MAIAGHSVAELSAQFAADEDFARCDRDYFGELLAVTVDGAPALDTSLRAKPRAASISSTPSAERPVARVRGAKFRDDVPTKVVINEAWSSRSATARPTASSS